MTEPIPLPQGFRAAGVASGIKPSGGFDLALFVSDVPASAAGVYTQNCVCGAPVKISRPRLPRATARAVVVNSGNANACTGRRGLDDARQMTQRTATAVGCDEADVLVCSTGVIGRFLPMDVIDPGIASAAADLADHSAGLERAAQGMMTTDTVHKLSTRSADVNGRTVRVSGAAKGAAMIGPNMATMLAVILTDAPLPPADADSMLRHAVDRSFNCISVEGHTSTSDSVVLLANGASGAGPLDENGTQQVQQMLVEVAAELAQAIVRDAEGASHFVAIRAGGLRSRDEAFRIAQTVANDVLVKTAVAGADPNWGRIVSCAGRTGVELTEADITLSINGVVLYREGAPADYSQAEVSRSMTARDVSIELQFPFGDASVDFWTSDLTVEYVRLNSEYTT